MNWEDHKTRLQVAIPVSQPELGFGISICSQDIKDKKKDFPKESKGMF